MRQADPSGRNLHARSTFVEQHFLRIAMQSDQKEVNADPVEQHDAETNDRENRGPPRLVVGRDTYVDNN